MRNSINNIQRCGWEWGNYGTFSTKLYIVQVASQVWFTYTYVLIDMCYKGLGLGLGLLNF